MSTANNLLCSSFLIYFFLSIPMLAQDVLILNGDMNQKLRINKSIHTLPLQRTDIIPNNKNTNGDWKIFKNWNEGRAVVAESDSIVWVGTPIGLIRWNVTAETYTTFDENNGLYFTSIYSLAIDTLGRLWIAATQGLAVYTDGSFIHYDHSNSPLPESGMQNVCIDNHNRVIVAYGPPLSGGYYQDGGIARFDGVNWQFWNYGSSVYWGPTFSMSLYNDTVWIAGGGNLFVLSDEEFGIAPGWIYGSAMSTAVDYENNLWVETAQRKTVKCSANGWEVIIDRDLEGMGSIFNDIWSDPAGGLWLSMRDIWWAAYGPYRLDIEKRRQGAYCGTSYKGICNIPGIPGQFSAHHALSATSQFFVSIGSRTSYPVNQIHQGGLYKFNGSDWKVYRVPTTILQNDIYGLGAGHKGDVFLSTPFYTQKTNGMEWQSIGVWGEGVDAWNRDFRFAPDGALFTNHFKIDSTSKSVKGLDFDGYGNLWTGYPLIKYKWPNFSQTDFTEKINEIISPYRAQFMDVIVDKNEHVWAAAWYYGGIMYNGTNWHPLPPSDTTLPNFDYDLIFADSKGNIWFGTNQSSPNYGFTIYDGDSWRTFYSPQRYAISYVYQIAEDHFGNVWLATGGGLLKYDGNSFTLFDSDNSPLSLNYTSAVTVDERGNIWIGTKNGLYVYNPNSTIELGTYLFSSPVSDFNLTSEGYNVKTTFQPDQSSSTPVRYQLQRGRGTHKFWTIAEYEYSSSIPSIVEMTDTSNVIGQYYYRISEVSSDGKRRFSQAEQYSGGTPGVSLLSFENFVSGNQIFFRWETRDELFVQRYELWCNDSIGGQFSAYKSIEPKQSTNEIRHYEIPGDMLMANSVSRQYSLRVVYLDSTHNELKMINVGSEQSSLPTEFIISNNYPNPFNSFTNFDVSMPAEGLVTIRFFNILGKEIKTVEEYLNEGYYSLNVEFISLPSGVYFYSVNSFGKNYSGKLLLLK